MMSQLLFGQAWSGMMLLMIIAQNMKYLDSR